jgi:tetratricopeptide (TPR) repeat protein
MTTASQPSSLPADFDSLVVVAEREHSARRLAEAAAAYRRIVALRPDVAEVYNNLGNVFKDQGLLDEAAAAYERAVAINPRLYQAYNNLGNILREQGKLDQAEQRYEQSLALRPDLAAVHVNLGGVLKDQGKLDEAAARYEQAVALNPRLFLTHNILGNIYRKQGKLDQAVAQYQQSLAIKPDLAIAYSNLGNVLVDQGKLDKAAIQFQRAVALRPGLFHAHVTLGCIFQEQGKLDQAAVSFKKAIALRPNLAEGHRTLGKVLKDQGKLDEARASLERALEINPDSYQVHNDLGCVFQEQENFDQAVACYSRALAIQPNFPQAHQNHGNALQHLGRLDAAAVQYDQALALRPDYTEAHYSRMELKTVRAGDPGLTALESLVANADRLPPEKMVYAHFALGKALEDIGDYPRAFEHLLKANALKRSAVIYDEATCQKDLRLVAEIFDSGLLDRFRGAGDPSPAPIFIVGMPRSGSTLVEQILASHPQVHAAGELNNLYSVVRAVSDGAPQPIPFPHCMDALDAEGLRRLGAAYLAILPALADGKIRVTDKMLGNFMRVGLIRLILPNARIIHTVRDPVDTCVSCFSKLFTIGHGFSYDLVELGRFYREYHRLMAHWRSVLPAGDILDVEYENVVDNLEQQARRLIAYCDLPWDDRCLSFHKNTRPIATASNVQVRQPLYRSSVARWRRFEAFLQPLLAELECCSPGDALVAAQT